MLLITNIFNNRAKVSLAYCSHKVAFCPKAIYPYSLGQAWEQFSQLLAGSAFNQLHHLCWTVRRLTGDQQMYMIRLYVKLPNLKLVNLRTKTNHPSQPFFNLPYQFPSSVFGNKSKVISDIIGCMCSKLYHTSSLSFLQPFVFVLKRIQFLSALKGRSFLE